MIFSMTGFGRGEAEGEQHKFTVEIKSVNHRYNDIIVRMPKKLTSLEERIKKQVKEQVNRGRVEIYISLEETKNEDFSIKPNYEILDQYYGALTEVKEKYDLTDDVKLSLLAKYPDAMTVEYEEADEEVIWSVLSKAVETAMESLMDMRRVEGEKLQIDIMERADAIKETVKSIDALGPEIIEAYKKKMVERIRELLDEAIEIDESRILHEVAIFADKTSVTEEIVRLDSHMEQLKQIFKQKGGVGRKLDFLIQEINREINTIGSKSPDIDISNFVIDIKSEIEKIREQIQNIE